MSDLDNKLQDQLTSLHADDEGAEPLIGTFAAESGKNVPVESGSSDEEAATSKAFPTVVINPDSTAATLLPNQANTGTCITCFMWLGPKIWFVDYRRKICSTA
jgi:hypothetical protein